MLAVLSGVLFAGMQIGRSGALNDPGQQVVEWGAKLEEQRAQVLATRRELQDRLDAIASRVGQMNAHVIRLDALGRRLTDMAKLDKGEFDFDREPAVGGPEGVMEGAVAAAPELTAIARRPGEPDQRSRASARGAREPDLDAQFEPSDRAGRPPGDVRAGSPLTSVIAPIRSPAAARSIAASISPGRPAPKWSRSPRAS